MPTLEIKQLFSPIVLTSGTTVLFTMPTTAGCTLKNGRVRLSNNTAGVVTVTMYADAAGTASSDANLALPATAIPSKGYLDVDIPTMKGGDTLRGVASVAASITMQEMGGVLHYA